MLWSKQFYYFDLDRWLQEHKSHPLLESNRITRNTEWFHMLNAYVISMPDKWEYPWYAAWDLAFHTVSLALVDFDFAKEQLLLMLRSLYAHPNGQIPAYEWNFSDVNPPVHAWAAWFVYQQDKARRGEGDVRFLEYVFQRLLMNFTWWVNRKDAQGNNLFEGGFLGLDNIGVFDRSAELPTGGHLEQADGTAWMAFYRYTRRSPPSSTSISSGSPAPWIAAGVAMTCGTSRTASSTTRWFCPTGSTCGSRCAPWLACWRSARPRCTRPIRASGCRSS
jgi:hypothetical protein